MEDIRYFPIGEVEQFSKSDKLIIQIDTIDILLFHIDGDFFAIENRCSHKDEPLAEGELIDYQIICPLHGARFDIRNGKALSLPAVDRINAFQTQIVNGILEIGIPVEYLD